MAWSSPSKFGPHLNLESAEAQLTDKTIYMCDHMPDNGYYVSQPRNMYELLFKLKAFGNACLQNRMCEVISGPKPVRLYYQILFTIQDELELTETICTDFL